LSIPISFVGFRSSTQPTCQPFQCVEYLGFLPVFGPVFHLAGFPMVVQNAPGKPARMFQKESSNILVAFNMHHNINHRYITTVNKTTLYTF
jgi:hypothetical protein